MHVPALLGIAIIVLSSCSETMPNYYRPTAQSWRGGEVNALLKLWGEPDQKITNFNGNTVYLYRTTAYPQYPTWNTPQIGVNTSQRNRPVIVMQPAQPTPEKTPFSLMCITAYEVDKKGEIIGVQVQGHGCRGDKTFLTSKRNPKNDKNGVQQ